MLIQEFAKKIIGQMVEVSSGRGTERQVVIGTFVQQPTVADVLPACHLRFALDFVGTSQNSLMLPVHTEWLAFLAGNADVLVTLQQGEPQAILRIARP